MRLFYFCFLFFTSMELQAQGIKGHIDGVKTNSDGSATVWGWACEAGLAKSIQVHMYLNGRAGVGSLYGPAHASLTSEAAVSAECGTNGIAHRYVFNIAVADLYLHAEKTIFVHGIASDQNNLLLRQSGQFVLPKPPIVPQQPKAPITTVNNSGLAVSWQQVPGTTYYLVKHRMNGGGWSEEINRSNNLNYASAASAGQRYEFSVRACNNNGCSASSLPSAAVTMGGIMGQIDSVSLLANGVFQIRGWVCDYGVSQSITAKLYFAAPLPDGKFHEQQTTAQSTESAVHTACSTHTVSHRFDFRIKSVDALKYKGQKLYVYGISAKFYPQAIGRSGILELTIPSRISYLHTDILGSVIAETDPNGQIIKTGDFKPFGSNK